MRLKAQGDGPLVVKLAGLAGGVGLYEEEMAAAAAAGFRVAALDTSGDRADDPAPACLSWDLLAGEVIEAVDRLGGGPAVLWGTSFGCLVCLAAAARRPDRVAGLLLCFAPALEWRPRAYIGILRWCAGRRNPAWLTARIFSIAFRTLNAWEFANPAALWRLPGLARAAADAATPDSTVNQKLALLWLEDLELPPEGIRVPTSIIAGAWDPIVTPSAARRLAARIPGSRLRVLRLAGHAGHHSRARTYSRWVVEELSRLAKT